MNYKITAIVDLKDQEAADAVKDMLKECLEDNLDYDKEDLVAITVAPE